MKPQDQKTEFIRLRAEGQSYAAISKTLGIAKDTCGKWEQEFRQQISGLKAAQLNELYDAYFMTREARIKKLGATLKDIDKALCRADLSEMAPEKLLDYKLKYMAALKDEFIEPNQGSQLQDNFTAADILNSLGDLLNRIKAGQVTTEQAARESMIFANLLKAYDQVELKAKIEALESVIGGRA